MKTKDLFSVFSFTLIAVLMAAGSYSCSDTEVTDKTVFNIYYSGMTDIGPSMSGIISSPTYKGSTPGKFAITDVTLNKEVVTNEIFSIDPDNGSISIASKKETPKGTYSLSISCVSGGKTYRFDDVVQINMMNPVPEGISVQPNKLQVEYATLISEEGETKLPTAQVTTDGNHVSIRKYEIAKSEYSDCFSISQSGEISIVKGNPRLLPGIYMVSLKLTTGASGEDEGIFENALEVNITSKPLALTYQPESGKIEEETAQSGQTTFTSNAPQLKGSLEGVAYAIKRIVPSTDKIKIDAKTGVLSVAANHGLKAKESFVVSVHVSNDYDSEGVDFDDVFTLEVVNFIAPIENFAYPDTEGIQAVGMEIKPNDDFKGDEVSFEFVDLDSRLSKALILQNNGTIVVQHGNEIPLGEYTIKVKATNPKSIPENPTVATFKLSIKENPYFFTYFRYGNNLGLTPAENYADQFRVGANDKLNSVHPKPIAHDAKVPLKWSLKTVNQTNGTTIDENTGEITLAGLKAGQTGAVLVTATAGEGDAAVSVTQPIFFNYSKDYDGILIEYTPFVVQANPKKKTVSATANITGAEASDIIMDYRRSFNYYSFIPVHKNGAPGAAGGSFLASLWENYFTQKGTTPNFGSKDPVSFIRNESNLNLPLGYVDNQNGFSVVVNPEKWIVDGEYANGVFFGQMTYTTKSEGNVDGSKRQIFPVAIWFDTKF